MGFVVGAQLSLAILRAAALCIRGSRNSVTGILFELFNGAGMHVFRLLNSSSFVDHKSKLRNRIHVFACMAGTTETI